MTTFFGNTRPGKAVTYNHVTFDLPILYFRDDFFGLYFTASYNKMKAIMPSDNLYPLKMPNGRAVIVIAAYNYRDTTLGPYGEIPVGIPVVLNKKGSRLSSLLPLIRESNYPGFGVLVQHLPVTKVEARDAGRGEWGYTKFVADMTFRVTPEYFQCSMSEKSAFILDLHVPKRGFRLIDKKPLTTYSVKNQQLIKTIIKQHGIKRISLNTKDSYINFGEHPVAESIKNLDISKKPFMSFYYTERSGVLPSGEIVEKGVRPFEGYIGDTMEAIHETFYTDNRD
ncbi:MAG: acetoacetate decarboxylase family protein [Bacteroidetes bacterium]|nr:acetoacetate decarboxylase family protein [Bacteroidota bacterium]